MPLHPDSSNINIFQTVFLIPKKCFLKRDGFRQREARQKLLRPFCIWGNRNSERWNSLPCRHAAGLWWQSCAKPRSSDNSAPLTTVGLHTQSCFEVTDLTVDSSFKITSLFWDSSLPQSVLGFRKILSNVGFVRAVGEIWMAQPDISNTVLWFSYQTCSWQAPGCLLPAQVASSNL